MGRDIYPKQISFCLHRFSKLHEFHTNKLIPKPDPAVAYRVDPIAFRKVQQNLRYLPELACVESPNGTADQWAMCVFVLDDE